MWGNDKTGISLNCEGTFYFSNRDPAGRFPVRLQHRIQRPFDNSVYLDIVDTQPPPGPITGLKCSRGDR